MEPGLRHGKTGVFCLRKFASFRHFSWPIPASGRAGPEAESGAAPEGGAGVIPATLAFHRSFLILGI